MPHNPIQENILHFIAYYLGLFLTVTIVQTLLVSDDVGIFEGSWSGIM
jgi:hypothetical protein